MAIGRMALIVTAMLDASTIAADALDLHFTATTLRSILSMAIVPWEDAIAKRQIRVTMEGLEDIPPLYADIQRLVQAFGNILSNAVKYTPDSGQITIRAHLREDQDHYEIVVQDTGVGIEPENQELIFEKFYRVGDLLRHSTSDTNFQGAGPGLGLHIARGVIEAHGGRIWVESNPGEGAAFSFALRR